MAEVLIRPGGVLFWLCSKCGIVLGTADALKFAGMAAEHEAGCGPTRLATTVEHVFWLLPSPRQEGTQGAQVLLPAGPDRHALPTDPQQREAMGYPV